MHYSYKPQLSKCSIVEIDKFIRPLEVFLDDLAEGIITQNQTTGAVYIELKIAPIRECIRNNVEPKKAADSIEAMMESVWQAIVLSGTIEEARTFHDCYMKIKDTIIDKLRKWKPNAFVKVLKNYSNTKPPTPIFRFTKSEIVYARESCKLMRKMLQKLPKDDIYLVMGVLGKIVYSPTGESVLVTTRDLRQWLVTLHEKMAIKANKPSGLSFKKAKYVLETIDVD